jgi:hypothetical protein
MTNGLQPIYNQEHESFFASLDHSEFLYDSKITYGFLNHFKRWIESSKNNSITGLEDFNVIKFANGSVQIFDHFYLKYHNKRFRFFQNEFMYHEAVLKHGLKFEIIEHDLINSYDAFIVSMPFTRLGVVHPKLYDILEQCELLNVPVLLDFCHLPVSKNVFIDLKKYSCIETLAFSFSKMLWGAEHLRIGIRLQKEDCDDGIDVFNSVGMLNRISLGFAKKIIDHFELDYNWKTYEQIYMTYCKNHDLIPTDNILYAMNENERVVIAGKLKL